MLSVSLRVVLCSGSVSGLCCVQGLPKGCLVFRVCLRVVLCSGSVSGYICVQESGSAFLVFRALQASVVFTTAAVTATTTTLFLIFRLIFVSSTFSLSLFGLSLICHISEPDLLPRRLN